MALIAIIDDDPDILETSTVVLESQGHNILTASDPDTAFNLILDKNPNLIILDVMMLEPDDGFFLAQKLRRNNVKTPILMYTSVSKTVGMDFGAGELVPVDDFVEKPISPNELIEKVNQLLK
jgi:DNA-binding response OmpR family regulator